MKNIFLTGGKRIGKSTIIGKIISDIDLKIGGYMTERQVSDHSRTFTIRSLSNKEEKYTIARVDDRSLEKEVYMENFQYQLPKMLDRDLKNCDFLVLDELGFMENDIQAFTSKIYEILDSDKFIFGVVKDHDCEFLNKIRSRNDVKIIEITRENRDWIGEKIVGDLKEIGVVFK